MKRTLSFLLALVMVLGTFTTVFAAEPTVEEAAGALLKEFGVLQGNQDGELNLGQDLKRRDAVVLLSRLMDAEEDAKVFPADDLVFDDITDAFYKGYVAWAVSNGLAKGKSATKFDPNGALTAQHFATFLLRALGHEVEGEAYDNALETAKELGLLADVEVVNSTVVKRGVMAVMTVNALGTPMNGSEETLAVKLGLEMPVEEPTLSTDIEVTAVAAIANNKVEVKVKEEVAASVADFAIVKKGTTTAVEVKDVVKESAKVFVLETEALVGGTAYTLTSNGKTLNFTGVAADTTAPTVKKLSATDTNTFKVEFSDRMDFASATNVENYKFNKDIKVVKATLSADRTTATLTTDAAKRNVVYTLTIDGVMNSDGKVIVKVSRTITAIEDRIAPRVTTLKVQNNRMLIVKFSDANGMSKSALENVENYSINDLNILSATAYDEDIAGKYETVVLMTEDQTVNKAYTLTMNNLVDGSVLANPLGKTTRGFRGASLDKTSPTVVAGSVKPLNNNTVDIEFNDQNAMDAASLEDISNYVITFGNNEVLPVLEAEAWDTTYPDGYSSRGVTLTTAQQEIGKPYKLEVKGVQDEFGNALKPISGSTYAKFTFAGSKVEVEPPYVVEVKYINSTKVELHFDKQLTNALDPTSYVIDGSLGSAIKVRFVPGSNRTAVELTTQEMANNKTYTVTINDVQDRFGNEVLNAKAKFVATASTLDVEAPSVTYAYSPNKHEVHVNFNEVVDTTAAGTSAITVKEGSNVATFAYVGIIDGGTTVVYRASGLKDVEYTLTSVTNIKDAAGNRMTVDVSEEGITFAGTTADTVNPEVEYIEQLDVKTFKVVFNEPVAGTVVATDIKSTTKIPSNTKDTYVTEFKLEFNNPIKVNTNMKFNLTGMNNLANKPSKESEYPFTTYLEDTVKPSITGVVATNNKEVVVTYDENVATSGTYEIYWIDIVSNKEVKKQVYRGTGVADDNEVTITLGSIALEGKNIYYLKPVAGAKDIANNTEDTRDVLIDFPGTDVNVAKYITGVAIINAKKLDVSATKEITSVKVYEGSTASGVVIKDNFTSRRSYNTIATIDTNVPVLSGKSYTVLVNGAEEYVFEGITPDLGITLAEGSASNKLVLDFAGYTHELFEVAVYKVDGTELVNKTVVPKDDSTEKRELTEALAVAKNDEVYVVLYDINDNTRVLYAAKVKVE